LANAIRSFMKLFLKQFYILRTEESYQLEFI